MTPAASDPISFDGPLRLATQLFGADSPIWVVLLIVLPIYVIGTELTVGPRLNA